MFFNEDPEHEARWEARERERLARWYQDRVKVDQAEQKPLPTAAAQPAQPAQQPLTETEVMAAFDDEAEDDDAAPFVFLAGVRFAERKHGIGVRP